MSAFACLPSMGMCHAWLLLTRHGPDGARAHTGYAYGRMQRPERRGLGALNDHARPCSAVAGRSPPRAPRCRDSERISRPYAQRESAHEVTRSLRLPSYVHPARRASLHCKHRVQLLPQRTGKWHRLGCERSFPITYYAQEPARACSHHKRKRERSSDGV
jgi:hypothetical protein